MASHDYRLDLTSQLVIATSGSDGDVTIPINKPFNVQTGQAQSSYWLITIAGASAYLNSGAPATSANVLFPVGAYGPFKLDQGSVIHALASTGTGQVSFTRVTLTHD